MLSLSGGLPIMLSFPWSTDFWNQVYEHGQLIVTRLALIVLILFSAWLAVRLFRRLVRRAVAAAAGHAGRGARRLSTLQGLLTSAVAYFVYFFALILVIYTAGMKEWVAPLLQMASVLGLAVGFGAQKLVRDIITGFFILGEDQFDVGDWVTIGAVSGVVEEIGLRVTRLRDEQGRIYMIANGDITQVFNASRGNVTLAVELGIPPVARLEEKLAEIQGMIGEVLADRALTDSDHQLTITVTGMDAAKITLRISLRVPMTMKSALEDAVRRRLLAAQAGEELALT